MPVIKEAIAAPAENASREARPVAGAGSEAIHGRNNAAMEASRRKKPMGPLSPVGSPSHRKTFSEASEVTIDITQETEATSPLTPDGKKSPQLFTAAQNLPYHHPPAVEGDESSNDDGSYFADPMNLPSPRSDRRFAAKNKVLRPRPETYPNRESDASLSLSEDSEDNHHHDIARHPGSDHRVDLLPQQLVRIHSISSLVSGSSDAEELGGERADHTESDEIPRPSGRRSPVLGRHPPSRSSAMIAQSPASMHNTQPSPPTILSSYKQQPQLLLQQQRVLTKPHVQHLQPHMALTAAQVVPRQVQFSYSSSMASLASTNPTAATATLANNSSSSKSLGLVYSEDSSDCHMHALQSHPHSFTQVQAKHHSLPSEVAQEGDHEKAPSVGFYNNYGRDFKRENQTERTEDLRISPPKRKCDPQCTEDDNIRQHSFIEGDSHDSESSSGDNFQVYWQRWLMLLYMSLLNLLSDWTCYSVAPIAVLTEEAFGRINSEQLVVLFLGANAVATACEPILLSRLGLRKTVLFGALLLMMGSIIKSGGMPPIIEPKLEKGQGEWRVYLGFFLVGLSQPLYQCTPALLSASWFPEKERTMATGVALNANQLGIGFAFIFGTLLVKTSDDILTYFSLLSILSTLTFLGTLIQFDDAPPTPPSNTARVMRGTLEVNLPSIKNIFQSVRSMGANKNIGLTLSESFIGEEDTTQPFITRGVGSALASSQFEESSTNVKTSQRNETDVVWREQSVLFSPARPGDDSQPPNASTGPHESTYSRQHGDQYPSPANWDDAVENQADGCDRKNTDDPVAAHLAPQDFFTWATAKGNPTQRIDIEQRGADEASYIPSNHYHPVWDARTGQYVYFPVPVQHHVGSPPFHSQHYAYSPYNVSQDRFFDSPFAVLPPLPENDEGVEPVLMLTPHRLDIEIRDDQVWLSIKACMTRPGFIHSLVSFTASGIVINTLSTFMDYLVRLNGAGREYTGIVGGSFQFVIMISSLVMGQFTDKTRSYYSIIIGMLVLGAFGLAECGVNLDTDKGVELRVSLIIVAALVGPLQPVSTELGVETAYPLSENTVLVIQQLFANLLSACFIPFFKAFKNYRLSPVETKHGDQFMHPQFTFSFYLLIVLHAIATVFFATFNGRYLRFEHEEEKKEIERYRKEQRRYNAYGSLDEIVGQGVMFDRRSPTTKM